MSSDAEQWQTSPRHEELSELVRWRLSARLEKVGLRLGLSEQGHWVVIGPSSATELRSGIRPVFLLPLLQMSRSEALSTLKAELRIHNIDVDALKYFPVEDIVVAGLESSAEHWSSLALTWAAEMVPTPRLHEALAHLTKSGVTQAIRHQAKKIGTTPKVS